LERAVGEKKSREMTFNIIGENGKKSPQKRKKMHINEPQKTENFGVLSAKLLLTATTHLERAFFGYFLKRVWMT